MKKAIIILTGVLMMLGLFGCHKKEAAFPQGETINVSVTNQVQEADVWVVPDTPENKKTTMWGATLFKTMKTEETRTAEILLSETDQYLLRVIDTDKMYYAADAVELKDGQSLVLRETDAVMAAVLEVYGADGNLLTTYDVFMSRL